MRSAEVQLHGDSEFYADDSPKHVHCEAAVGMKRIMSMGIVDGYEDAMAM